MLVLSRKLNESIVIGKDIRVTVVGFRGNQVRIGIEAPEHVKVFREEVCFRIEESDEPESIDAWKDSAVGETVAPACRI